MSGELYGLSGPGQRVHGPIPPGKTGEDSLLDSAGQLADGITLNPLRLLAQALGADSGGGIAGVLSAIANGLLGAITGTFEGGGILGTISDLLNIQWFRVNEHESSLADLQDKTQALEGVIGHASFWMPTSPGTTTSITRMPFTARSGPIVGIEPLGDGRLRLLSRGSWDINAQVEFWGGLLMPPGTYMRILVRDPAGEPFFLRDAKASTSDNVTLTNVANVVVPTSGYTVEVEAWTDSIPIGGTTRGIRGGFNTTGLYIRKVSSETS